MHFYEKKIFHVDTFNILQNSENSDIIYYKYNNHEHFKDDNRPFNVLNSSTFIEIFKDMLSSIATVRLSINSV